MSGGESGLKRIAAQRSASERGGRRLIGVARAAGRVAVAVSAPVQQSLAVSEPVTAGE